MSRRSRKTGPAITLFFFQDIIMSTSGIMIMIVLLLCLELIERPEISAAVNEITTQELEAQVIQLQQEVDVLEQRIAETNAFIQSASQMSTSERNEQIRHLQTANQLLEQERQRLQTTLNQLKGRDDERAELQRKWLSLQERLEAALKIQFRLQNEYQAETKENRPLFSLSRGDRRSGWIVDISGSRIQVAPLGRAEKPKTFVAKRIGILASETAADAFLNWVRANSNDSNPYYFLFVRPDGVEPFETISTSFNDSRVAYGFDVVNSSQTLLHPERGAGE